MKRQCSNCRYQWCVCLIPIIVLFFILIGILIEIPVNNMYSFTFSKVDGDTNLPLEGAVFELRQDNTVVATTTSEMGGNVTFSDIPPGEYTLVETQAPTGYVPNTNTYSITVDHNGNVTVNGSDPIETFIVQNTLEITYSTVVYEPNGGSGDSPLVVAVPTGSNYQLIDNPFQSGLVFAGWNTQADGSGTSYNPNDRITVTSDLTLYAMWEVPKSVTPSINNVLQSSAFITGTGIPGSVIEVNFPSGLVVSTTVQVDGTWLISIPGSEQPLTVGSTIIAYQTEVGKTISDPVSTQVIPNT